MSCILDTSFLVAVYNPTDSHHERAQQLLAMLLKGEFGQLHMSDYLFDEFLTVLLARTANHPYVLERGAALLQDPFISLAFLDPALFRAAWLWFRKYPGLSFTDCTTVALADALRIEYLISFDHHFDRIRGLKRIC